MLMLHNTHKLDIYVPKAFGVEIKQTCIHVKNNDNNDVCQSNEYRSHSLKINYNSFLLLSQGISVTSLQNLFLYPYSQRKF